MRSNVEYESLVNVFRVDAGLTHRELAQQANVTVSDIISLANGMKSPLKANGDLCISAKRICEFFGIGPEEIFPRYICALDREYKGYKYDIQPYESWSDKASDNCGEQLYSRIVTSKIIKEGLSQVTAREERIFCKIFFDDEILKEVAENEKVSSARVAKLYLRVLNRIRCVAKKYDLPNWR
jgi:DNA-directed RNA polymerase specialized sigma subunit